MLLTIRERTTSSRQSIQGPNLFCPSIRKYASKPIMSEAHDRRRSTNGHFKCPKQRFYIYFRIWFWQIYARRTRTPAHTSQRAARWVRGTEARIHNNGAKQTIWINYNRYIWYIQYNTYVDRYMRCHFNLCAIISGYCSHTYSTWSTLHTFHTYSIHHIQLVY